MSLGLKIVVEKLVLAGGTFGNVVELACRTNPTLQMCQTLSRKTKLLDDVIPPVTDETSATTESLTESLGNETSENSLNSEENTSPSMETDVKEESNQTSAELEETSTSETDESQNLSPDVSPKDMVFQAASFLKGEPPLESVTAASPKSLLRNDNVESLKEHYCQTYISNFTTYCHGKERFRLPEIIQNRLVSFCDSFKSTCYPVSFGPISE